MNVQNNLECFPLKAFAAPSLKLASKVEAYPNEQSRVFLRRIEEKETFLQNL
jgi:hypothetical protein